MNKQQRLKKQAITIGIFCVALCAFCLVLAIGSSIYNSDLDQTIQRLNIQRTGMQASQVAILKRFEDGQKMAAEYQKINPENDPTFGTLDRKNASVLMESLNQKYKLKNLSLDISPAKLQTLAPYQRKSGGMNTSTVKISFESVTDEYAYSVMRDIIASFPGFLHVSLLNLTKNTPIDDQILYDVQNGEIPPKVKSEFAFDWLGLEIKNNDASATPPTVAP
jgi:hypothetical protein